MKTLDVAELSLTANDMLRKLQSLNESLETITTRCREHDLTGRFL